MGNVIVRRLFIIIRWLVGLLVVLFSIGWLVLESSLFSDFRRSIVATALSEQIGQPLVINDDVQVSILPDMTVIARGVVIPSENLDDVSLAELKSASFNISFRDLFDGKITIDNLIVTGLHVSLVTKDDYTKSWTPSEPDVVDQAPDHQPQQAPIGGATDANEKGFINFFRDKTVNFNDIRLIIENDLTGFDFRFVLKSLLLEQREQGAVVAVTSTGTVNGQVFTTQASLLKGNSFAANASFGALQLHAEGALETREDISGFHSTLSMETKSIGEFLEVLGLNPDLDGTANFTANMLYRPGYWRIRDIDILAKFQKGQSLQITGQIEDLLKLNGVDVSVNTLFQPAGAPLEKATSLRELRITEINAHIIGENRELGLKKLIVKTNYFDQEFNTVGPIRVGRVKRTEDGELSLNDINLQIGPLESPFVKASGDVRDILKFKGVEFDGQLAASADIVLRKLDPKKAEAFGSVKADFSVTDASGELSLTSLKVRTENSDLWSMTADLSVGDVTKLGDMNLKLDLGVADGARFLEALGLDPVDTGNINLAGDFSGSGTQVVFNALIDIGGSKIAAKLSNTGSDGSPIVRGGIESEKIDITDLKNVVASVVQIASLSAKNGEKTSERKIKPLVIEPEVKPLVIKPEIKPLVIEVDTKLVDPMKLLENLDLEFGFHIKRLVGQAGISGINSDLEIKGGNMRFGPLEANYAGGYFNASARMDLINSPQVMRVSGKTSGWDFGEILDSIGLGIDAHGKLEGRFDLTGNISSGRNFVNSMFGSATIYMSNGNVATSLLELAGLGIFPWLFSQERRQGYTDIVCAIVPVRIEPGRAFSDSVVVETKSVQLLVKGIADWRNDTISVRAEPRPVGRPLARSAWPFLIRGKLSDPEFKLLVGGVRAKRSQNSKGAANNERPRKPCSLN